MAIVFDLDGVIWLADTAIPGSVDGVHRLREAGHRVLFVTNNSASPVADVEAKLDAMGISAAGDVITSSHAAASLVAPGERVHALGGPGLFEELAARGVVVAGDGGGAGPGRDGSGPDEPVQAVVVGRTTTFDFDDLARATTLIRAGARFIATNDDATFPTPHGLEPGNGAIVAAVATAAGTTPVVAGKPYAAMASVVRSRLAHGEPVMMVGDRPDTDGRFAEPLGASFALVLSGVTTTADLPVTPAPVLVADDVAALVEPLLDWFARQTFSHH